MDLQTILTGGAEEGKTVLPTGDNGQQTPPTDEDANKGTEPTGTPQLEVGVTKVDVSTLANEAVAIDNVEYLLDASGNAYTNEGVLAFTKSDIDAFDSNFDIEAVVNASEYKIIIDGQPRVYENTAQGFLQREKDIAESIRAESESTAINKFFEKNPDLYQVYEHKVRTGTIDDFKPMVDYSKITLSVDKPELLKAVIREVETRAGKSEVMINKLIDFHTKDNSLLEVANEYQAILTQQDAAAKATANAQRQASQAAAAEKVSKFYGVVEENGNLKPIDAPGSLYDTIVNKRSIGGVTLPEAGITYTENGSVKTIKPIDIFNNIALSADAAGNSKFDIVLQETLADPAKRANLAVILMRNTQLSSVIDGIANKKVVTRSLSTSGNASKKTTSSGGRDTGSKGGSVDFSAY